MQIGCYSLSYMIAKFIYLASGLNKQLEYVNLGSGTLPIAIFFHNIKMKYSLNCFRGRTRAEFTSYLVNLLSKTMSNLENEPVK